jgi:hypothetical protein
MHHRRVDCRGYLRDDGMWDIEGHLVDTKPYDIPNPDRGGTIRAGEHLHEMWIRLTVDTDLVAHAVEAKTDFGPYSLCGDITDNFRALVGLRIAAGWTQETRELLGGVKGCTHLVRAFRPGRDHRVPDRLSGTRQRGASRGRQTALIRVRLRSDGGRAGKWRVYTGPVSRGGSVLSRLPSWPGVKDNRARLEFYTGLWRGGRLRTRKLSTNQRTGH